MVAVKERPASLRSWPLMSSCPAAGELLVMVTPEVKPNAWGLRRINRPSLS